MKVSYECTSSAHFLLVEVESCGDPIPRLRALQGALSTTYKSSWLCKMCCATALQQAVVHITLSITQRYSNIHTLQHSTLLYL